MFEAVSCSLWVALWLRKARVQLPHYIENDLHLDPPAGACLIPRHKITHQSRVAVGQATHRRTSIAMVFSTCATSDIKTSSAMHPSLEHMFLLELSVTRMPTTTSVHQSWRLQREKLKFLDANMLTKSFRMPYVLAWQRSFWKSTISMFVQSAKSTSIASQTQTMIHTTKFPESWALLSPCLALTGCQLLSWFEELARECPQTGKQLPWLCQQNWQSHHTVSCLMTTRRENCWTLRGRTSIAMVFSTCATSDIKTSSAMHPSLERMFLLELSVTRMPTTTSVHQSWRLQREKLKFLDANMLTKSFRMPYVLAWQRSFWKSTISMFVQSAKSTSIASRTQTMIHTTKFPESWALLSPCLALTGCQLLSWFRGSKIGFLLTKRQASELEMASISFTYTVRVCLGPPCLFWHVLWFMRCILHPPGFSFLPFWFGSFLPIKRNGFDQSHQNAAAVRIGESSANQTAELFRLVNSMLEESRRGRNFWSVA